MTPTLAPIVRYAGTYRFADRNALERALSQARTRIDEDDDLAALEGGWIRCFVMSDDLLTINLALPALAEHQFVATEVFATLSRDAVEGSVRATVDDVAVCVFHSLAKD